MKKKHKYLGVTLGTSIKFNDYIKEKTAIVIQSKPKVSIIRETLGENMANARYRGGRLRWFQQPWAQKGRRSQLDSHGENRLGAL